MTTVTDFKQFELPELIIDALNRMEFLTPTAVQAGSIPPALEGRDVLATAQTGTGKTGAFAIPMLTKIFKNPGQCALVMAPTRELAGQIFKVCQAISKDTDIEGCLIVGGESFNRQVSNIRSGPDYIIATPGRLNDHLDQRTLRLGNVTTLVLDECDRMLDMGFAPQIKQVLKSLPSQKQTLLFSATLPKEVLSLVNGLLKDPVKIDVHALDKPAERIDEQHVQTSQDGKINLLLEELTLRAGKVLIFTRTKARTDRLAKALSKSGHSVVYMHGGRTNGQRKDALSKYKDGAARIMVATDIAGRGIDVEDIEQVINYDVPMTREDYIHRIGRTARYGKSGIALSYVTPQDHHSDAVFNIKSTRAPGPSISRSGPSRPRAARPSSSGPRFSRGESSGSRMPRGESSGSRMPRSESSGSRFPRSESSRPRFARGESARPVFGRGDSSSRPTRGDAGPRFSRTEGGSRPRFSRGGSAEAAPTWGGSSESRSPRGGASGPRPSSNISSRRPEKRRRRIRTP